MWSTSLYNKMEDDIRLLKSYKIDTKYLKEKGYLVNPRVGGAGEAFLH
jgi:hypothetical protein